MSYSLTVQPSAKDAVAGELDDAIQHALAQINPEFQAAAGDHLTAVAAAVERLIRDVGRDGDHVSVNVSGHANPGHAPLDGWSNETLSISLGVIPQEAPAPMDSEEVSAPEAITGAADAAPAPDGAPAPDQPGDQPAGDGTPTA